MVTLTFCCALPKEYTLNIQYDTQKLKLQSEHWPTFAIIAN